MPAPSTQDSVDCHYVVFCGRFELLGTQTAEVTVATGLIVEVLHAVGHGVGGVLVGGSESKFYMRISDAKDGTPLWADVTGEAGLVSNSAKRLVSNLRSRMDGK